MKKCVKKVIAIALAAGMSVVSFQGGSADAKIEQKPILEKERISLSVGESITLKIKNVKKVNVKKLTVSAKDKTIVSASSSVSGNRTAVKITGQKVGSTKVYVTLKMKKKYKLTLSVTVMKKDREGFSIWPITDELLYRMKQGNTYKSDCIVPREDLRYIQALHKDINGNVHLGEMVVHELIAEDVLEILEKLYDADYPIERMVLPDNYMADDEIMMRDNNSSGFNFRFISHTTTVSKHGLGMAVDINTLYNPYHKIVTNEDGSKEEVIEPATGKPYLDRTQDFDYKIEKDDLCYKLFIEKGFEWGGDWTDRKDYQHFELPTSITSMYSEKYSKAATQ